MPDRDVQTYMHLLELVGGAATEQDWQRGKRLIEDFKHFCPDAKPKWDAYCASQGIA